jgi:DNA-directed RNA polymerase beta subunit
MTDASTKTRPVLRPILEDSVTRREKIRQATIQGLSKAFPLKAGKWTVELSGARVEPREFSSRDQKMAILEGRTLSERVRGDLTVRNAAGEVTSHAPGFTLLHLPYFTPRHTFILDGTEYSVSNQLRTKPGVYVRRRGNEELEAAFNLSKGANFKVLMEPEKGLLYMQPGSTTARIALYPVLRAIDVPHQDIARSWGSQVAAINRDAFRSPDAHVSRLYEALIHPSKRNHATPEARAGAIREYLDSTSMDPEVNRVTLGAPFDKASGQAMLAASNKILEVHRRAADVDDRDSLSFKTFHSVDDFIRERLQLDARAMRSKLGWKLEASRGAIKDALPAAPLTRAVTGFLTTSSLSAVPMQINPMELVDEASRVTLLGEGAISSERAIPIEARDVHPTHLGIIDPTRVPESFKVGVDLRLGIGARRDDQGNLYAPVRNVRTGKDEYLRASEMARSVVAFPDGGNLRPGSLVSAMKEGSIQRVPSSEVTHQIRHMSDVYGATTNLLPLLNGMQGNRALMASKHQGQALPLVHREAPLVQVESWNPGTSVEREMVRLIVPTAPVAGRVERIDADYVHLSPEGEKQAATEGTIRLHYDHDLPLAAKTYLDNRLTVKEGDVVRAGQPLAESNFTRDGVLALGTNLRVAYMPYRGLNTNDGIVVSQGAADKLTSEHMFHHVLSKAGDVETSREKHRAYFGGRYSARQYDALDESGVARPGTVLQKGDPIMIGVRRETATGDAALLGRLSKSLVQPYAEVVETWTHDHPGIVADVSKTGERHSATIKTYETLQVGDKMCFDEATEVLTTIGWKRVKDVTTSDKVCTRVGNDIVYTYPEATHHYPTGGRMYYIRSQQIDQVVTDSHQLFVKRRNALNFELLPATEIAGRRVRYCKHGRWQGEHRATFTLPPLTVRSGQGGVTTRDLPEQVINMDTFLMLLGAFLSEGNTFDCPGSYGIDICQTREPNRQELIDALTTAGVTHCFTGDKIRIYNKQLMLYCKQFGLAHEKFIPDELLNLPSAQLMTLFKWLMWGDGTIKNNRPVAYFTTSPRLADDVQRLCLHLGWAANIRMVHPGGPTIIQGKPTIGRPFYRVSIITSKLEPEVNHGHVRQQNAQEEGFLETYDRPVYCVTVPSHVLYVRRNGKPSWSGNSNRYGAKGVVAKIVPDAQMIQDEKGRPVDVILTSAGIITRINPAQLVEASLGKVAEHRGEPILVPQFADRDAVAHAKGLLKANGLSDKETVVDPATGRRIPGVFVGKSYFLKLFKTTDSNWAAHGAERYDYNQQPARGGDDGAKGIGKMEFDGLVAHNARAVLRESAAIKSQRNDEFWRSIQLGTPAPAPRTPFAYDKLHAMLAGAGVKVSKQGSRLALGPLTDADVKRMSSGALPEPAKMIRAKDLRPETGGMFDPTRTGGMAGTKWSHVELSEPIVNPVFEEPVRRLLGLTHREFTERTGRGGEWFRAELDKIDVPSRLEELRERSRRLRGAALDDAVKQAKYLAALQAHGLRPADAYVIGKVPVTPPVIRPILPLKDGRLQVGDANLLYRDAFLANDRLREAAEVLPESELHAPRRHLYDAVGALFGVGDPVSPGVERRGAKGYIATITGSRPGSGFFQSKILKRQQDVSGRATIAPDPTLSMDEIGVPEDMLWGMYSKFVIGRLVKRGYSAIDAQKLVDEKAPIARDELINEARERPVMVNRAPSLTRHNIIGAYPRITQGKTITLNPFAERGTNADYDGDAMQIHAPVTPAGVEDVKRMTLSHQIFADRRPGMLNVAPDMEAVLGLHRATQAASDRPARRFESLQDARAAYHRGEIALNDPVHVGE